MNLPELVKNAPSWLSGEEDAGGIVVSCRARLARNLADCPFATKITEEQRDFVVQQALAAAKGSQLMETATFFDMSTLDGNERRVLVERHLVSPALADTRGQRGVLFNQNESLSIMINEEDHLRMQAIFPGLLGQEAWSRISALDDELSASLDCAYTDKLGYLTACPTNTGTGLRMSVLIHLPGLVLTEDMERVLHGLNQLSFAVRGVYGEGSNASGNLFQVSNQSTLGSSEERIVEELMRIAAQLVEFERDAQETLIADARSQVEDKVWRAYGLLSNARVLSSQELMNLLSAVRLGLSLSVLKGVPSSFMNQIMITTQPAHLQAEAQRALEPSERDLRRAELVRRKLAELTVDTEGGAA